MSSILPNYEYDIFISYRQNDNKYDGWVTEFVDNLQKELDATLKNPVSIYFDENPHDGLQDTHQVGASLEKKLKCLVFIPIISQTYCDTSSFAWEQEFLPFNKMAREDELGMNIILANGNVASRVLPIKIHDLDDEDQIILEKELGGRIRSIDFIYKEPGVNRPLSPEDNKEDNINAINYKNQLNKVANALKEINSGAQITANSEGSGIYATDNQESLSRTQPKTKSKISLKMILGVLFIPVVLVLAYYFYSGYRDQKGLVEVVEKSIAVLPFADMSPDKDQEWFSAGLTEELNNSLANVPDLIVRAGHPRLIFKGKTKKQIVWPVSTMQNSLAIAFLPGILPEIHSTFTSLPHQISPPG